MQKIEELEVLPTTVESDEELLNRFISMGYDRPTAIRIIKGTKKSMERQLAREDVEESSSVVSKINDFFKDKE